MFKKSGFKKFLAILLLFIIQISIFSSLAPKNAKAAPVCNYENDSKAMIICNEMGQGSTYERINTSHPKWPPPQSNIADKYNKNSPSWVFAYVNPGADTFDWNDVKPLNNKYYIWASFNDTSNGIAYDKNGNNGSDLPISKEIVGDNTFGDGKHIWVITYWPQDAKVRPDINGQTSGWFDSPIQVRIASKELSAEFGSSRLGEKIGEKDIDGKKYDKFQTSIPLSNSVSVQAGANYYVGVSIAKGELSLIGVLTAKENTETGITEFKVNNDGSINLVGAQNPENLKPAIDTPAIPIVVTESTRSKISEALGEVTDLFNKAVGGIINGIVQVLDHLLIIGNLQKNAAIIEGWKNVRDASNILLVLGLIIIALANVTRFQIDYYTAKALIPRLVLAAIFINFSLLMTQVIMDLGNVLTAYFLRDPLNPGQMIKFTGILPASMTSGGGGVGTLGLTGIIGYGIFLFWQVLLVSALVALIALLTILVFRIVLIWLLAIFSPLVFLFSVLPFTRGLTSTWWTYLTKYVFMGTVVALILSVAAKISGVQTGATPIKITDSPGAPDQFLMAVAIIVLLIAAAMAPIVLGDKLAKAISGQIGNWARGAKKSSMARSRGGSWLEARRKIGEKSAFNRRVEGGLRGAGRRGPLGALSRTFGVTRGMAPEERASLMKAQEKQYDFTGWHKEQKYAYLENLRQTRGIDGILHDARGRKMVKEMIEAGILNDEHDYTRHGRRTAEDFAGVMLADGDGEMVGLAKTNQPHLFLNREFVRRDPDAAKGMWGSALTADTEKKNSWESGTLQGAMISLNEGYLGGITDTNGNNMQDEMEGQLQRWSEDAVRKDVTTGNDKLRRQILGRDRQTGSWTGVNNFTTAVNRALGRPANTPLSADFASLLKPETLKEIEDYVHEHPYSPVPPEWGGQGKIPEKKIEPMTPGQADEELRKRRKQ